MFITSALCAALKLTNNVGIKIALPKEILSVMTGMTGEVNVTNIAEQSVEGTVSWPLEGEVVVKPYSTAAAELTIIECALFK